MKLFRTISRILVGLVFVFSGFVKGVDPLGTAYKIEDYFLAYHMGWAMPLALFLSIFLSMVEFTLGSALILNLRLKKLSWLLLLMMSYFTLMTFFDAVYNPVPDCGCFGDALKLTNWQTFYKNLVLMVFVLVIFKSRKKFKSAFRPRFEIGLIVISILGFCWFSVYQYNHLPFIDFREWKVGTNLNPDEGKKQEIFLTYRNIKTGETKEYLSPDYPWNDSVWMSEWEFISQRLGNDGGGLFNNLYFEDFSGNDFTDEIINNPSYQFLLVSWNIDKFPARAIPVINNFIDEISEKGYAIQGLSSSLAENIDLFRAKSGINIPFYNADDILLKTMIRANPGIVMIKDGIILAKWHYNDCPEISKLEKNFQGF